jgi:hypothetical protein
MPLAREGTGRSRQNVCLLLIFSTSLIDPCFICRFILVADYRKNVQYLGTNVRGDPILYVQGLTQSVVYTRCTD